jgi:hypothetical protein
MPAIVAGHSYFPLTAVLGLTGKDISMAETGTKDSKSNAPQPADERVPFMQRVMDNPFLLLFLGVTMPTVLYLIWGIMELVQIPVAPP